MKKQLKRFLKRLIRIKHSHKKEREAHHFYKKKKRLTYIINLCDYENSNTRTDKQIGESY